MKARILFLMLSAFALSVLGSVSVLADGPVEESGCANPIRVTNARALHVPHHSEMFLGA